ncbi:hypothetical protein BDV97DRAFT_136359 [Delphinella strobiligena]|nr:hypothetical protein BDV97DRAFT_136359 [Delphinella strobiligena]
MTGLDWMYEATYHPLPDQGSPKTSPLTSPIPIPTLKFVARPGHEEPWDSPIESPTQQLKDHAYAPHVAHPGFESPWDSPIESVAQQSRKDTYVYAPHVAAHADARSVSVRIVAHPGFESPWDSPIESPTQQLKNHVYAPHAPHPGFETPWDSPIYSDDEESDSETSYTAAMPIPLPPRETTSTILRERKPETVRERHAEAPWDSPIETADHPLFDHHALGWHLNHLHASGVSTPTSSVADPGFESPWDSPINSAPMTPFSEVDGADYLGDHDHLDKDISVKAVTHSVYGEDVVSKQDEVVRKEHPALGHFALKRVQMAGCALSGTEGKEEFLWHMYGGCGCGRKALMTPLRRE